MENMSLYIFLALWAITTGLLLSSSEDWFETSKSPLYIFCAIFMPMVVYVLLAQRSNWTAERFQLHADYDAKADAHLAAHEKRERKYRATIADFEETVASHAAEIQAAKDAAFHRGSDLHLENNRLKRELRHVETGSSDITTIASARVIKIQFDTIRKTLVEAGHPCDSPSDVREALNRLCKRKLTVAQCVSLRPSRVIPTPPSPLPADLEKVQRELDAEKIGRADLQTRLTTLEGKIAQMTKDSDQQSADLVAAQESAAKEKAITQNYKDELDRQAGISIQTNTANHEETAQLRAMVQGHAEQLQECKDIFDRACNEIREACSQELSKANEAMTRLEAKNQELKAAYQSLEIEKQALDAQVRHCLDKHNGSTNSDDLRKLEADNHAKIFKLGMDHQEDLKTLKAKQQARIDFLEQDLNIRKIKMEELDGEFEEHKEKICKELRQVKEKLGNQEEVLRRTQAELDGTQEQLDGKQKELSNALAMHSKLSKQFFNLHTEHKQLKERCESQGDSQQYQAILDEQLFGSNQGEQQQGGDQQEDDFNIPEDEDVSDLYDN